MNLVKMFIYFQLLNIINIMHDFKVVFFYLKKMFMVYG